MPDSPAAPPVPQWTPSQRELDDLDILVTGALGSGRDRFDDVLTLVVASGIADSGLAAGSLDLIDPEGAPLARLSVEGSDPAGDGLTRLIGPVAPQAHNEFGPFRRLHRSPDSVHADYTRDALLAVPVRGPLSRGEIDAVAAAATLTGRRPLLIALVGEAMPNAVSAPALVRMTLAAAGRLADSAVVAVSLADHGDATDELVRSVALAYASEAHTLLGDAVEDFPDEVAAMVERERPDRADQGAVIFFTGLSGSGKSTLARALVDHVLEQGDRTITSLDGDVVRHHLSKGLGFSREDRETNILRIGFVAAEIARHGGLAICSPIAPFESTRTAVRQMVERAGGGFVLIHVSTPLEECERRDRKGLYAKARRGEIPDFTGISSPYEEPLNSLKIDTTNRDIAECLQELVQALVAEGWLRA